jgi:hypothetical protein
MDGGDVLVVLAVLCEEHSRKPLLLLHMITGGRHEIYATCVKLTCVISHILYICHDHDHV